jgi:hypothetical protein
VTAVPITPKDLFLPSKYSITSLSEVSLDQTTTFVALTGYYADEETTPEAQRPLAVVIDQVLASYSEQLEDPSSPHSEFFLALASATTDEELRSFSRAYRELFRGDYTVDDFLEYHEKSGLESITIAEISSFMNDTKAAKVAGIREKLLNGSFQNGGNLYAYISRDVISSSESDVILTDADELSPILLQGGHLRLKPMVSYQGSAGSYATYFDAVEDYWDIARSYFSGTFLSSVTTRTGTVSEGSKMVTSVSPNTTGITSFSPVVKVSGTGSFGPSATVRYVSSSSSLELTKASLVSGSVTFKSGLPAVYQTLYSKSLIDVLFNENSGNRPYSYASLMADPASKTLYTSQRQTNSRIREIALGLFERITRDELEALLIEMASEIVDYNDENEVEIDYSDPTDLPDISEFVEYKLGELDDIPRANYDVQMLRKLKFYKFVMSPFAGVSDTGASSKEVALSSEFSSLRDGILGLRSALLSGGNFEEA